MLEEHKNKIYELAKTHAPKYAFGSHTREDMVQEAFLMGMDAYKRWDHIRPFDNFICKHMSNRLKTFKRDRYFRPEGGSLKNQEAKRTLAEPAMGGIIFGCGHYEINFAELIDGNDKVRIIDAQIPNHMRRNYIRMKDGAKVDRNKKLEIISFIIKLLGGKNG